MTTKTKTYRAPNGFGPLVQALFKLLALETELVNLGWIDLDSPSNYWINHTAYTNPRTKHVYAAYRRAVLKMDKLLPGCI